ncbi:LacI family DNA-binding transcriptional regulator [Saccharothrix longispora]|uniref:LacI family DNA-binding transcriptional regulator n=1 Tax=Saccharothrix longispora TaxID=33920 RepID=UPI0028FD12CF|nr:LacI family DNA-binding transcriptional regulator [Saccharothrix longispora]MBY8850028.1 LacI family transcriptional regulator [Saccharothrix sp. MB29]MDU0292770.1 LacI family DNA-binding transcriptional regulator [Saccharothrix longispora]
MDGATARLGDIAAQAGVSEATVSRVFNGKAGVSATTRQAVVAAVDLLGHERPPRLRQRSAGVIGLITPEPGNPIFPAPAQVVEQVLTGAGYTPLLCTRTPGGSTGDQPTEMPVERGVAGIAFVSGLHAGSTADTGRYTGLAGRGVPFVVINGHTEEVSAPFTPTDDRAAVRLAVSRDVSVVGFDDSPLIVFADPPPTTLRRPVEAMGRAAVHALPEEIGGTRGASPPSTHAEFVFLPEPVVRGSTGARPR